MLMTGPYVAGLDTVANTTAAIVYTVLKHPDVLARIHAEVDALYAKGRPVNEDEFMKDLPALNGAIMETMRLYPIAVDRKSVVEGKGVSVRVDPGGRRISKKN